MQLSNLQILVAALAINAGHAAPTPAKDNTELIGELTTTPTDIERLRKILAKAGQTLLTGDELAAVTVFNFDANTRPVAGGQGGTTSSATIETFPILFDTNVAMAHATLGPCGLVVPHVHPRGNEVFLLTEGELDVAFTPELGLLQSMTPSPDITSKLTKNMATLFPQGSIHWQINDSPDCEPASFFTTFDSNNPGTTPVLVQNAAGMEKREANTTDFEGLRDRLPANIVQAVEKCFARCGSA